MDRQQEAVSKRRSTIVKLLHLTDYYYCLLSVNGMGVVRQAWSEVMLHSSGQQTHL